MDDLDAAPQLGPQDSHPYVVTWSTQAAISERINRHRGIPTGVPFRNVYVYPDRYARGKEIPVSYGSAGTSGSSGTRFQYGTHLGGLRLIADQYST